MKKIPAIFITAIVVLFSFMGCAKSDSISGKTYKYEGKGFGGDFTIQIKNDGSFEYSAGVLSSYIGIGNWSISGDVLTLADDHSNYVNHFKIDGNSLIFMKKNSTNFMYVKVEDGEKFTALLFDF